MSPQPPPEPRHCPVCFRSGRDCHCGETPKPCPHCLEALEAGFIRREGVQPLRGAALDPVGLDGRSECRDCAFAGTLVRMGIGDWDMMRTAVSNHRQESMRLPGAPIGLALEGARISEPGEFESHLEWLDEVLPEDYETFCED